MALKHYNVDPFPSKQYLDSLFSATVKAEVIQAYTTNPLLKLKQLFESGHYGGDNLIDLSCGHVLAPLFLMCDYFKDIVILDCNDESINELNKWIKKEPGAHDWQYASKFVADLEGKSVQDIEEAVRHKLSYAGKCDFSKENIASKELRKADCVFAVWALESVSEDCNAYCQNLKKMSSLLRVGGHIIMIAKVNTSCIEVEGDKFFVLKYDEEFLTKTLSDMGYFIKYCDEIKNNLPTSTIDGPQIMFVVAEKQ